MMEIQNLLTGKILNISLNEYINQYKKTMVSVSEDTAKTPAGTPKYAIFKNAAINKNAAPTAAQTEVKTITPSTNTAKTTKKKGCGCK